MPVEIVRRRRKGAVGGDRLRVRDAVLEVLRSEDAADRVVAVLLTDDREIHELNAAFRDTDRPTDVLAFALDEAPTGVTLPELGDVVISVERARAQAKSRRVTLDGELELLAVHGTLHLLGYDHAEPADARKMRQRTRTIRARLGRSRVSD